MVTKDNIFLISGATGNQGGAVAAHLLKEGFKVRALTRNKNQEAAHKLELLGAEIVEGDFNDPASLQKAFEGVYGAYSVQNVWVTGIPKEIEQGKAFADAALKAGVSHFIYGSVGGVERKTGVDIFDSKLVIEKYIQSLGLPATFLRPVFFMNNWLAPKRRSSINDGKFINALAPDTKFQQIAADDIGAFATLAFKNPEEWIGKAVEIAGSELTMAEIAEHFSKHLNKKVEYVQISPGKLEETTGQFVAITKWFEREDYVADISQLRKMLPTLTDFDTFLREINY